MNAKKQLIALSTLIHDEVKRFSRIWVLTLFSSVITMTLYFVIFNGLLGKTIGMLKGISYLEFITPGLVMMTVIINAYNNVAFSFWDHRYYRSVEKLLISPLPNYLILLGYTIGGVVRGLLVGLLVMGIAWLFTPLTIQHGCFTVIILILTAAFFSAAGFTTAILANNLDDLQFMPMLILIPLTYLGGVFYSVSQLAPFWQAISKINPLWYIIDSFRYGMLNIAETNSVIALEILLGGFAALFFLNLQLLRKGVGIRA